MGMKLLPPLFASYPRQGRVAPTLLIASICRQLQHPVQACPFCHNVDKTCSVLFTTPIQERRTNCTQRLVFTVRKANVANSPCPSLNKADATRQVGPPFGPKWIGRQSHVGQQLEHDHGPHSNGSLRQDGIHEPSGQRHVGGGNSASEAFG